MPLDLVIPFCWFCFARLMSLHRNLYCMSVFDHLGSELHLHVSLKQTKPFLWSFTARRVSKLQCISQILVTSRSMDNETTKSPLILLKCYNTSLPLFGYLLLTDAKAPLPLLCNSGNRCSECFQQ